MPGTDQRRMVLPGSFAASSFLFTLMRLLVERAHLNLQVKLLFCTARKALVLMFRVVPQFQFMGYAVICGAVVMTSAVWPIKPFTSPDDLEPPEIRLPYETHGTELACTTVVRAYGISSPEIRYAATRMPPPAVASTGTVACTRT
eukprot:2066506-Rhodomonas_salina.3